MPYRLTSFDDLTLYLLSMAYAILFGKYGITRVSAEGHTAVCCMLYAIAGYADDASESKRRKMPSSECHGAQLRKYDGSSNKISAELSDDYTK